MNQAAVGFQCPSCVNEGRKATRSGRAVYGGLRSNDPSLTSKVLIALNGLVWLLILATGGSGSPWLYRFALVPGLIASDDSYWRLVTSMFTHVSIWHIGFNMLALWFLGPQLEAAIGRARFLTLYFLSGLTASLFVYWLGPLFGATIGASGAIFGLLGGLLVLALKVRADISQLLFWIGLNFVITVLGHGYISWQGHLGGFIGGALIALGIAYAPRRHRGLWQALGAGGLVVVLVLGVALRTLTLT